MRPYPCKGIPLAAARNTTETSTLTARPVPRHVFAARNAVAVVFALNGLGVAAWFSRVPAARDVLGLDPGQLGLLLLVGSAGALLAPPTAGEVTHRLGTSRTVALAASICASGVALVGVAAGVWKSVIAVGVGLFALGYGSGTCDVAMNVEAAAVERRLGRTIMPRFHAGWSLGTVAGAAVGAGGARIGLPLGVYLVLAAVLMLGGTLIAVRSFLPTGPASAVAGAAAPDGTVPVGAAPDGAVPVAAGSEPGAGAPGRSTSGKRGSGVLAAWREPRTLLIGTLVLVMAFTEGTANDWLAVGFVDGHGVGNATGAAVFGVFVAAMTAGRLFGTIALDRWGRVRVLTATILLAAAGAAIAVMIDSWPLALIGVALWGLGASLGFPVGMSAAADEEHRAAARVSVVAVIGYSAFLAGPPIVGLLGNRVGILQALLIVPILLMPALLLVPATRPPAARPEPTPLPAGAAKDQ